MSSEPIIINLQSHKVPVFTEPKGEGGLVLFGDDAYKPYPDYCINLYHSSTKHNSIINAKVRYITGGGLSISTIGKTLFERAKFDKFIRFANNKGESWGDISKKICLDGEIHNGFCWEVIWDKAGKQPAEVYHLPFALIRAVVFKDKETKKKTYKYCYLPDWTGVTKYEQAQKKEGFREFEIFGTKKTGSEIVYYKEPRPVKSAENDSYPIPYYVGAIPYIECDMELANYNLNALKNKFMGGTLLNFNNGVPSDDEKAAVERKVKSKFTGTDNANSVIVQFNDNKEQATTIENLSQQDWYSLYEGLNKQVREEIFTTHSVTNPKHFGIAVAGELGGNNSGVDDFELFYESFVVIRQKMYERVLNGYFNAIGINPDVKFNKVKPKTQLFDNATLIQYIDRADLVKMAYKELGIEQTTAKQVTFSKEMSEEDKYLAEFERLGSEYNPDDVLDVVELEFTDNKPSKTDSQLRNIFLAKAFDFNFTDDEANVLSLLNSDEKITPEIIAEALDLDVDEVNKIIDKLQGFKIITGKIGENVDLSEAGKKALKKTGVKLQIEVKYRYAGVKDAKNRPFCARLLAMNKVYSRAEIDAMENENGDSAWVFRGGFYHNPKTDLTTPFCRHHWEAVIMKKEG